ncbi:sulfotransferase family protein [Thiomicrolovo sp. ZZH C-3]
MMQSVKSELKFICVGAQKSGTTSLHEILASRRDVYLPTVKETKFFQNDEKYGKGLEYYFQTYFSAGKEGQTLGEIDPEYLYFENVPQRIHESLGTDIKLIFIFRNPADRAYSHYLMSRKRGFERLSFEAAIEKEKERLGIDTFHKSHFSYIDRGYYTCQLKRYLQFFPKENMYFVIFEEDLVQNKEETLNKLMRFLDLDQNIEYAMDVHSNKSGDVKYPWVRDFLNRPSFVKEAVKKILLSKKLKKMVGDLLRALSKVERPVEKAKLEARERKVLLEKYFMDDIKELESLIGRDLGCWYK